MSLSNVFSIAGSAMTAQSQRLNAVASNLANADSATSSTGQPYRAKQVVFSAMPLGGSGSGSAGVKVAGVIEDPSPMKRVYDPKHPLADAQGFVTMPNVNVVEEMVNMIQAQRAYEINSKAVTVSDQMLQKLAQL